ncbi:MAG: hypothetical protein GTO46_07250 [Gemmatimonadetes bacterium]|nr:hypothetical protein [Gemmatimonadota bacterium]NIO31427.1 hypothetical protein [Gemmatimonadota bacterium]
MHIASSKYPMILAVAALGAFLLPEWNDPRAAQDRATIRIIAYNIKHGEGGTV